MPRSVPCCVDAPAAEALLRYGLAELLRGLGLAPTWTSRDDARLVVAADERGEGEGRLVLPVTAGALADLGTPRQPPVDALGWTRIDGERWPVPVGPAGESAALGDLVAGAAWWLAGVQERAVAARDRHGRFPYAASLQAALAPGPGGPLRPAVDAYRWRLAHALREAGVDVPGRTWAGAPWAVAITHDLDSLRTRRLRAGVGALLRGDLAEATRRALGADRRWATAQSLADLGRRHEAAATWFVKPGRWAPEDLPVDLGGRTPTALGSLVRGGEVGWHPGYGAHDHPARLDAEVSRFRAAFGHAPALARTHFLRWSEPATPRLLAARGVALDSTLGFAEHEGFRRGTAHPFRLYDLDADRPTDLWEMPLAVMDATLTDYRRVDRDEGARAIRAVFDAARQSGGVAVVLWHNQMGGSDAAWDTWLDTLDRELGHARATGAHVGALEVLLRAWTGVGEEDDVGRTSLAQRSQGNGRGAL